MKRWLIGLVVALGVGAVAVEVIDETGIRDDGDAPQRVRDAASRSLSRVRVRRRAISDVSRYPKTAGDAGAAHRTPRSVDGGNRDRAADDHPEVSVIC